MADFLILDDEKKESSKDKTNNKTNNTKVSLNSGNTFTEKLNNAFISFQKIKVKEKVIFYRLLSTMTNA
jgi:hypothetical protein